MARAACARAARSRVCRRRPGRRYRRALLLRRDTQFLEVSAPERGHSSRRCGFRRARLRSESQATHIGALSVSKPRQRFPLCRAASLEPTSCNVSAPKNAPNPYKRWVFSPAPPVSPHPPARRRACAIPSLQTPTRSGWRCPASGDAAPAGDVAARCCGGTLLRLATPPRRRYRRAPLLRRDTQFFEASAPERGHNSRRCGFRRALLARGANSPAIRRSIDTKSDYTEPELSETV